ncbi:hypothetical protein AB0O91_40000 [Kitasatospora sp. NPDC089797]|uniref:hypothetical protein n=1 Tax=Kitasatospora sp. NPDC089797 TaxID=3155298 RepID=UPI003413EE33
MDGSKSDEDLWALVVTAEQQVARARADFYQNAGSRRAVLSAALRGSAWDRGAALSFLEGLPSDVPTLLDQLVGISLSTGSALAARKAIAARNPQVTRSEVRRLVEEQLPTADADDWRRLAELHLHLNDRVALRGMAARAEGSGDPEIREVGQDILDWLSEDS